MVERSGVCVVTHPITDIGELATAGLLELVAAASESTYLITANLPDDSEIRDQYSYTEISNHGMGGSIGVAAVRFVLNQIRMCIAIMHREEDIILFFGATSYLLPILFARVLGKRVIVEPRGNVPDALYGKWSKRMSPRTAYLLTVPIRVLEWVGFRLAHKILTLSPSMSEDLGVSGYGDKLHEHGARPVDTQTFCPQTPYDERPKRIGYLGRLDEEKGVDVLVEVVKNLDDNYEFMFIGGGVLQEYVEDELSAKIDDGTVKVTGWIDHEDIPEYLASLRLMITTSRTEGVPTTILESMACGTPVCATSVGGVPDVVEEGETGYLLDPADPPEQYAEQITSVLMTDNLETMSDRCREYIVENYGFDIVVEKYQRVFEDMRN